MSTKEEIFDKIIWHFGRLDEEDYQDARDASEEIAVLAAAKCMRALSIVAEMLLTKADKSGQEILQTVGFDKQTIDKARAFELYNKNK